MKPLLLSLLIALLLSACSTPSGSTSTSGNTSPSTADREDMAAKLITFQQRFDRYDDNGDGFLSRSEITNGFANDGIEKVNSNSVDLIFAFYDTNHDQRISLAEVNAGYNSRPDAAIRLKEALDGR